MRGLSEIITTSEHDLFNVDEHFNVTETRLYRQDALDVHSRLEWNQVS